MVMSLDSKIGGRRDPEYGSFFGTGILKPVLFLRPDIKTFPLLEFHNFLAESKGYHSLKDIPELFSFMGSLFWGGLTLTQGEEDRLQASIGRAWNHELKSLDPFFFDRHPILLSVDDLFLNGPPKELGDVFVKGIEDLDQTVQGDGGQVPFDLRNKPLGQIGPLGELLLGEVAQLSEASNPFTDLHCVEEHYRKKFV
jgi:hypothetical protein